MLVQRPAVQLPGQLGAELRLLSVLHWVCGQLLAIEARLDYQTEAGTLREVTTWGRKDGFTFLHIVYRAVKHTFTDSLKLVNYHQSRAKFWSWLVGLFVQQPL